MRIFLFAAICSWAQQTYSLPAVAHHSTYAAIRAGQLIAETPVAIDRAESVSIHVAASTPTMTIALTDPAGAAVAGERLSKNYVFALTNPVPGRWTIRATEQTASADARVALIHLVSSSDLRIALAGVDRDAPSGRPVEVVALLVNGPSGSTVRGTVRRRGGEAAALALREGEPGVWKASFTPAEAGEYAVAVTAEGMRDGVPFVRSAGGWLRAAQACGTLSRTVTARSVDADGNQRAEALEISLPVTMTRAARAHLSIELAAANGRRALAVAEAQLESGARNMTVRFDLASLRATESAGPFVVATARLSCVSGNEVVLSDSQEALGAAGTFTLASAERRPILATGANLERTVDTNGNLRFERLEIGVSVDVTAAGLYHWNAALFDAAGKRIAPASGSGALTAGLNLIVLPFDGLAIGRAATDGPFIVGSLIINGPNSAAASFTRVGRTRAYLYDQFEGAPPRATTPRISRGGVVNAASFAPRLSRGSIATIFGANLSTESAQADRVPLPRMLAGVRVSVGGVDAPLFFAGPGQINFQVPFETALGPAVTVTVTREGMPPVSETVAVDPYAVGIFSYTRASVQDPIALHADGTLITPSSPARPGEIILLYATGAGELNSTPATGLATPSSPLATTRITPIVSLGGTPARVLFSGLAPGFAGLLQLNLQLPGTLPQGDSLALVVSYGAQSQTVRLAVSPR
jgi:uncharacterized protein (TIGR03437 family)